MHQLIFSECLLARYFTSTPKWMQSYSSRPWELFESLKSVVLEQQSTLADDYFGTEGIMVHKDATVEKGAVLKAPIIIGPNAFVASTAYLRDGVILFPHSIVGPSCELKSTVMLGGSKIAHLSFVGDSIIGKGANVEAGAIIANFRNESPGKNIEVFVDGESVVSSVRKFGSLVGDSAKIGANSVLAPGTLIEMNQVVPRLALVDQLEKPFVTEPLEPIPHGR